MMASCSVPNEYRDRIKLPMRKRSQTTRKFKWTGLAVCAIIVVAWTVSLKWHIGISWNEYQLELMDGQLWLWDLYDPGGLYVGVRAEVHPAWEYRPTHGLPWPKGFAYWIGGNRLWGIPLWLFLITAGPPTILLWRHDRRFPKGHCQTCGYNLTGNVSGTCPECGKEIVEKSGADC